MAKQPKVYTVFVAQNKIDNKIFVGTHSTHNPNDTFIGSTKHLRAIIKEAGGKPAFRKIVLGVFKTEDEAFALHAKIVTEDFVKAEDTYNRQTGGRYGYIP